MKISYYPETDSLYIHLSDKQSTESLEILEGIAVFRSVKYIRNDGTIVQQSFQLS